MEVTTQAPAKSVKEQTGWQRPRLHEICQNDRALNRIREFDFDIHDKEFVAYFEARTGQKITRCECGWEYVANFLANPGCPPLDSSWKRTRARLQDCWEVWKVCRFLPPPATVVSAGISTEPKSKKESSFIRMLKRKGADPELIKELQGIE